MYWLSSVSALSETVVILGDNPRANLLYKLLLPYADRIVTFTLICQGSASRPLGMLAATLSRYDDAERHFADALEMNTQIKSPLWTAHTQHEYACMLLVRNRPGDNNKALQLLDYALATADKLGFTALANKARASKLATEEAATQSMTSRPV
jgi:tetratricopeptide (TPR) repeat protein